MDCKIMIFFFFFFSQKHISVFNQTAFVRVDCSVRLVCSSFDSDGCRSSGFGFFGRDPVFLCLSARPSPAAGNPLDRGPKHTSLSLLLLPLIGCSETRMQRRCCRTLSSQPPEPQRKSETGSRGFKVITFTSPVCFFQSKVPGSFHTWQEISKLFCFHLLFLIISIILEVMRSSIP